jgi:glutamine amidotransferase
MITIINYGSGNIGALANIYEKYSIPYKIATSSSEIENAEKIILPGVGAFDSTMQSLNQSGLRDALDHQVLIKKVPVLGICVGMQIMANGSEEGTLPGLNWINARVKKFSTEQIKHLPKIPHLGWNTIQIAKSHLLMNNIDENRGFYFIHSYYVETFLSDDVLTTTFYGHQFTSAIQKENIIAVQFHPEKSHKNGVQLLLNFSKIVC